MVAKYPIIACSNCNGKGHVTTYLNAPFETSGNTVTIECNKCKGTGTLIERLV